MDEPLLARCTSASMLDRVAIGEREGELVWRIRAEPPENKSSGKSCATSDGFSVHANTAFPHGVLASQTATRLGRRVDSL